ncbi:MAG: alanine racemase [Actinomycetota bacterium]
MALRLTVRRDAFFDHVRSVARDIPHLVPVVKGNGYGLGRGRLAELIGDLLPDVDTIAVGTIHEANDVPTRYVAHVMNPVSDADFASLAAVPDNAVLTVGSQRDVDVLARSGWKGRVVVKLASSMRRFGVHRDGFGALVHDVARVGGTIHACSIHPPTTGDDPSRLAEIRAWLPLLPGCVTLSVSHLSPASLAQLRNDSDRRTVEARLGTALWHGTKGHFALHADVIRTEPCRTGETAGYRATAVPGDGTLVVIGAGSAHGVMPLPNGDSPFHFSKQRIALVESPYMHSSIAFVPMGEPCPAEGDFVDVQRPLTMVHPDVTEWV